MEKQNVNKKKECMYMLYWCHYIYVGGHVLNNLTLSTKLDPIIIYAIAFCTKEFILSLTS